MPTLKFAHIVMVPVTGVGVPSGFAGESWFAYRLKIFKQYTLESLKNQVNKSFLLWLTFRPEEENHPLVKELGAYLNDQKIPAIMTFHGLMYHDDRFSPGLLNRAKNIARVIRKAWRDKAFPNGLFQVFRDKNKDLVHRLERALHEIRKLPELQDANYIYLTRIDSDDCFHKDAIKEIQEVLPFEGALVYKKGYVYNHNTKELASWEPDTCPPFSTIIFLGSVFFNPISHLRFYGSFRSHEDIPSVFTTKKLSDGRYCVIIHSSHISTVWGHQFKKELVGGKERADILKSFHLA